MSPQMANLQPPRFLALWWCGPFPAACRLCNPTRFAEVGVIVVTIRSRIQSHALIEGATMDLDPMDSDPMDAYAWCLVQLQCIKDPATPRFSHLYRLLSSRRVFFCTPLSSPSCP